LNIDVDIVTSPTHAQVKKGETATRLGFLLTLPSEQLQEGVRRWQGPRVFAGYRWLWRIERLAVHCDLGMPGADS